MEILIYGIGNYGKSLFNVVKSYKKVKILGIADSFMKGEIFGYKIINLENIINIIPIHTNIVIAMANVWNAVEISKKLKKMGYINIYLYLNKTKSYINNFLDAECISLNSCDSNMLPSIELHVTDFCNLNCKGCVHFFPFI